MAFPDEPCPHCPRLAAGLSLPCEAMTTRHARHCERADPDHPDYSPNVVAYLLGRDMPGTARVAPTESGWQAPEPIGLLAKAGNLAKASAEHLIAGLPAADEATQGARIALCRACVGPHGGADGGPGYWDASTGECRHPSCNCPMRVKTWWREQKCPIGKW